MAKNLYRSPKFHEKPKSYSLHGALSEEALPGGHDNNKDHLLPHHAPEVSKGFW